MKYIYDEDTFYKTCKLSRQEFLQKIEKAKDHKKLTEILDIVYKADVNFGRRGVMSLNETNQIKSWSSEVKSILYSNSLAHVYDAHCTANVPS